MPGAFNKLIQASQRTDKNKKEAGFISLLVPRKRGWSAASF